MGLEKGQQILKCRDDAQPVKLSVVAPPAGDAARDLSDNSSPPYFSVNTMCAWAKPKDTFGSERIRARVEPWLTALCQSEHLSLLLGSGLSHAVHAVARGTALPGMTSSGDLGEHAKEIETEAKRSAQAAGREDGNVEDRIRVANELIRGLEILASTHTNMRKSAELLRDKLRIILSEFAASILEGERSLITANEKDRERAFNYLVSFLMSFASRTGTRDRLHVFTTNYDRYLEAGAEVAGLHLLDRFVGSVAPVFRSSRLDLDLHYNPPGIRGEPRYLEGVARFTKLHGSLDWVEWEGSIRRLGVAFGAKDLGRYLEAGAAPQSAASLMIYPNAAKDRETAAYPYVELFRDLAAAVCRPNHTLVSFGYSFGDEHINRVVEDMLTIPSTHLVVISYGDPLGRILALYEKLGRHAQTSLLLGDHLGDLQALVDSYLPKPAIDRTTFRMAELLRTRWTAGSPREESHVSGVAEGEGPR